jgi:hypothetical protein
MVPKEDAIIAELAVSAEGFYQAKNDCSLDLVDIYPNDENYTDRHTIVVEAGVH